MFVRDCSKILGLICLILPFTGCTNTEVSAIQISPATQSLAVGQTVQFTASGYIGHGTKSASTQDVTSQVTWTSSTPAVATVNASGLGTAVGAGTTTISASMPGTSGATATVTATAASGGTAGGTLVSIAIIPSSQSVASPGQTSQFIAIGTGCHNQCRRTCHGPRKGHHHHHGHRNQLQQHRGDGYCDLHGDGRNNSASYRALGHSILRVVVCQRPNGPVYCAWDFREHRTSTRYDWIASTKVEFQHSNHSFDYCWRTCQGNECRHHHDHGRIYKLRQ